jgi:hypothetical protein
MRQVEQPDSRPVMVKYPNGFQQVAIAIADDTVEVDAIGLYVELYDIIEIDGVPRQVAGIQHDMKRLPDNPANVGVEYTCRLRHSAVPE